MKIIYKPGPDIFIAEWLSRQKHSKDKDAEILGLQLGINIIQTTTNISECMTIHELQEVTCQDKHMWCLKEYIIQDWPEYRDHVQQDMRSYWTLTYYRAVIHWVIMKGGLIVVPEVQALQQLHITHMGFDKTKLLACESVYWIDMKADI